MKKTLTELAQTIDNHLKIEDPEYLLELQAKDAVRKISDLLEDDNNDSVNIRNLVNILYEGSRAFYEIPLSTISRTILAERGMKEDEITVSDVTSISKSLKGVFETNLGFTMRIGKKRRRVIIIPAEWAKVDSAKHKNLFSFEAGDSYKDVHQDTYVHQSERKNSIEKFFPDHDKKPEVPKKKSQCKKLTFKEDQPFCEWLQSFLVDSKKCNSSECDGYEEGS